MADDAEHRGPQGEPLGEPLLVFVHIPKTAGTTLRTILSMNEPRTRSRALANVFKGGGGTSNRMIERLRRGKGANLSQVRLVRGHFPLGIRDYLPKDRDLRCFAFLREPVDRTLSHYFAIREYGHAYQLPPLSEEASVDDALEAGYIHDNLHTRMLSGLPEPFGEVTEEMLEGAKRNLREELVFFGLSERFDESLVLAKRRLGLDTILYRSSGRVNTTRPRGDEVPDDLLRAAERCNRYDIELYRYAQELFEAAPERGELEFQVDLAALRAARDDGEVELEAPVPESFGGDEEAWRMLVRASATAERLRWEGKRHRIPHVVSTLQDEARENDRKATAKRLEQKAESLRVARSKAKKLEREVESLRGARRRVERLEQEVERLRTVASRVEQVEQELQHSSRRTEELEQKLEQLKAARSRKKREELAAEAE